jgi:hypothetical protein
MFAPFVDEQALESLEQQIKILPNLQTTSAKEDCRCK